MSDWIDWKGGGCPVNRDLLVDVVLRDGEQFFDCLSSNLHWNCTDDARDIVSYRIRKPKGALGTQIQGDHYLGMKIQPIEFINANNFDFLQGSAIKYLSRHKLKGKKADVEKAIHFCKLILELQYGEGK